METGCALVFTTINSTADGQALASALVGERLAACVGILPPMTSVYRWEGSLETAVEHQLVIKTTVERLRELEVRLRELHAYDVPEFIVVPIVAGSERYLAWLKDAT